ncbi:MAG: N-acetyl-D-myo-inositol-2-amino-2-deoxy-alpha-D-glucopyranoside deacetylase [Frankiaceae bacterium]|nr:N-acetyl-D-myo-inositol-2-amino-2-deoxy-alpha-D-glucopyranoside deacetylase [Frankiaceae bacterium]
MTDRRLLLVHAHPDDETIGTGASMAKYAAAGAGVTLVTCTLGEEGEVVVDDLAHLAVAKEDRLGEQRITELAAACAELGVTDHRFLGGAGRYRDSGMMGEPTNDNPACFWRADFAEAVGHLVRVVRDVRPQVLVTYDDNGGYGHPDHIQAHRVAVAAYDAAGDAARYPDAGEPWQPSKLYFTAVPMSVLRKGFEYMKAAGGTFFDGVESADGLPFGTPDELVTTRVDAAPFVDQKMAAMHAHRSQIADDSVFFAYPPELVASSWGVEYFILARGALGPAGEDGFESDLFG